MTKHWRRSGQGIFTSSVDGLPRGVEVTTCTSHGLFGSRGHHADALHRLNDEEESTDTGIRKSAQN